MLTPPENAIPKFVHYLVQSNTFTDRVTAESIGTAYPAIAESRLGSFEVCVPPRTGRHRPLLDHADRRIFRYVGAKGRLIALLEEEKQAAINRVVTRGIDPKLPPQTLRRGLAGRRAGALGGRAG